MTVVRVPGDFVAGLPIEALGPSSDVRGLLHRWGIWLVGELVALGQEALAERLGLEALALWAAASVTAIRPLNLVQPTETFAERHPFDPPVETVDPVLFLLRRFTDSLGCRLESCGLAAGALRLELGLEGGGGVERRISLPQATRKSEVLFRILQTQLETVRTDQPVVEVSLVAEPARPEERQFLLFEAALKDPQQFQETLARLASLLGPDRVGTPRRQDGHRPDAFVLEPPDFDRRASRLATAERVPDLRRRVPMRRFRPALPATVELSVAAVVDPGLVASGHPPQAAPGGFNSPVSMTAPNIISWLEPVLRPGSGSHQGPTHREPEQPAARGDLAGRPCLHPSMASSASPDFPPAPPTIRSMGREGEVPKETAAPPADVPSEGGASRTDWKLAQPVLVQCGSMGGGIDEVLGPWRSSGHWWEAPAWQREEWHVATRARVVLHLALEEDQWRVEGILD